MKKNESDPSNEVRKAPALKDAVPLSSAPDAGDTAEEIPDSDLVLQAQAGDPRAFEALVNRYRGKVYAMIYNMIHNDADAWDLAQDTFLKAWKALPGFEARAGFYTWLYRITHNVTYDWMRKKKITSGAVEFDDTIRFQGIEAASRTTPAAADAPDVGMERSELGARIRSAIEQLSPDHRAVILLKEVEGLKYEEIATSLECSVGTVMSRLFYARKKLQMLLADVYGNGQDNAIDTEPLPDTR
ncbi:MAG: sigma-70 family RNA polymerase sigma factor [Verrucomicrobia bacterium]|nr:sigma-70 family RNA polymerase sigma factor [Verrucomicrobiota bacterium]